MNSGGVILNVNNEYQRSTLMSKGVQRSKDDYHKGIVSGCYDNGLIRLNFYFLLLNRFLSHMTQDWMTRTYVTHC
jgi:hypothetical protein